MPSGSLPEIRIKHGWLLHDAISVNLHKLWGDGKELASHERVREIVAEYQEAWEPYEEKILTGMTELLGTNFRQNIIDVYVAPWFKAFSDPMVIGVIYEPDEFVDVLTHELLHRLLTDNTATSDGLKLVKEWKRLFGEDHSFKTLVHIPVHSLHKAIYFDVLNEPQRLHRELARLKENKMPEYLKAWEYVEEHGYQGITEKLSGMYQRMK